MCGKEVDSTSHRTLSNMTSLKATGARGEAVYCTVDEKQKIIASLVKHMEAHMGST